MIPDHRKEYQRFLTKLVALRKQQGISQVELGRRLGVEQSVLSKCERGVRRLDVVELLAILKALEIDPAKFVRDVERS